MLEEKIARAISYYELNICGKVFQSWLVCNVVKIKISKHETVKSNIHDLHHVINILWTHINIPVLTLGKSTNTIAYLWEWVYHNPL